MQNAGPPNNRNFGNRLFNSNNGGGGGGNAFQNDRFEPNNQNINGNFYDDFDLNEFAKNLIGFDRANNGRQDFGGNRNFNNRQDSGNNDSFFGSSNWNSSSSNNLLNSRGGTNNRFSNNNRNFANNDDSPSGQHCIHMRGLPYYTDEMDVFNVGFSLY